MRWLLGTVLVVLAASGTYFQLVIAPERTATRFGLEVAGAGPRVIVEVDPDNDVVAMSRGVDGLSRLIATRDSLFVLAADVDAATDVTWVSVTWEDIGGRPDVFSASGVSDALSIGIKDCRPLNEVAVLLVSLMFAGTDSDTAERLCGTAFSNIADRDMVIADENAQRPKDMPERPRTSVATLAEVSNREQVLALLSRMINGA